MIMPDWGWLSRGALLGLLGTTVLTVLFSIGGNKEKTVSEVLQSQNSALAPLTIPNQLKRQEVPVPTALISYAMKNAGTSPTRSLSEVLKQSDSGVAANSKPAVARPVEPIVPYNQLFATPVSLGMLAIGSAEGTYRVYREDGTLFVEQTSLYYGHTDPGNLSWGQRVTNYGPCSDQSRSGGNIELAEQMCLERARQQLPTNLADLRSAGIDPGQDIEALINTADLYNQAKQIHSRRFPEALTMAQRGGLKGIEAIAWARTASFYLNENGELDLENGENKASGLLGICARENRPVTEWECVHHDQMRRTREIAKTIAHYFQIPDSSALMARQAATQSASTSLASTNSKSATKLEYQFPAEGRISKAFSSAGKKRHPGVDIAAPEGTPVVAAADGEVIAAGLGNNEQVVRVAGNGWGRALVIIVAHPNGERTLYAHNQRNLVLVGQKVKQGQTIARVGKTGDATQPHLHFELHRSGKSINPLNFIQFD
ncbi:M23 family metallopeptidase [Lusitaniella coriacea LEGE 07157]|uniref:M23 family metallopeptidase n=2 Tax=Lusitaniella TaxID=1983104 RepID=A0A8J7DZW6_9CYAN|nr:M23 family metallopeptidase [Lusitaniella coriacea]MBE9118764.1 M23 family metallopeptidase [Lusitaniella coriacea LEGE 07157]